MLLGSLTLLRAKQRLVDGLSLPHVACRMPLVYHELMLPMRCSKSAQQEANTQAGLHCRLKLAVEGATLNVRQRI
jgi:hypothetical protein